MRLPCAHIFHSHCILDWLDKSNTCPVCRYELLTDNAEYEVLRREKMQHYKPRFAEYELQRMTIRELRQLGERLRVNLEGCVERQHVIDVLRNSGRIHVIVAPRPVEYPLSLLRCMKISELKRCMADAGVFFDPKYVVEKEDMVQLFIASGRLVVVEEEEDVTTVQETTRVETQSQQEECGGVQTSHASDTRQAINASTPIVTTVHEDSSDEDEDSCRNSKDLPQSNPLMEEIVFEHEENAPESHHDSLLSDDNSVMEDDDQDENDNVDQDETDGMEMDMNDPMDSLLDNDDDSSNLPMQHETGNVETAYPRLVGRHASTGSVDIPLVDDYASATTTSEDSRFVERSISDLQALAREMRVDITDCIERSEITARLVSATGRTDLQLEPNDFATWSVSELRALARAVNVDLSCCADRLTMIARLIEVANERPRLADYLSALMPLAHLTVPQLRAVGREWQVNLYDCIEKEEMIHRLVIAGGPSSSQH